MRGWPAFVAFDLEYTAWEGSMARRWKGPGEHRELVQIGAVLIEGPDLSEIGAFEVLVRPRRNPVLSAYFEALTGITNADLAARGVDFLDAMAAFDAFRAGRPYLCFGRDDLVLSENVTLYALQDRVKVPKAVDVSPWLAEWGLDPRGLHACDLARAAGVDLPGRAHDALFDARSVAAAIRALVARGAPWPIGPSG